MATRMISLLRVVIAACALVAIGLALQAQTDAPDYATWESVAERAENALEADRASDRAFEALRDEVASWRTEFQAHLSSNDRRLQTLREQVDVLGPEPEDGQSEPLDIAQRRADLQNEIDRLDTPRRLAEEAYSRANGIVAEIDTLLRERQTSNLLYRGPVPIKPGYWPEAIRDLHVAWQAASAGLSQSFSTPSRLSDAQNNLPVALVLLAIGLILVVRSRSTIERFVAYLAKRETKHRPGYIEFTGFIVSLGQILFPLFGLFVIVRGLSVLNLLGTRGDALLEAVPVVGFIILFALWIGTRMFPAAAEIATPIGLRPEHRREGRIYSICLGAVFALHVLLNRTSELQQFSDESEAVLNLPLTIVAAMIAFRIGLLLKRHSPKEASASDETPYRDRLIPILGRMIKAVAIASVLLAVSGYTAASKALIYPAISTLALFGTISTLTEAVHDLYALITNREGARDSLFPTLLGYVLIVISTPLLALIWGARVTDLTEVWAHLRAGITIGDTTISPSSFFTLLLVFIIGYFVTRAVQGTMKNSLLPKTRIDPGGQNAIVSGLGYVGITISVLAAVTAAGINLSSLAIVAGALSVGIGFGLQNIVSNFVSGIILLVERPISEGDWVEVGGKQGYVRSISVRSTRIETFDRSDVIVPNADFVSGTVTNYTRGNTVGRLIVPVGVGYGSDTRKVEAILREIAEAHPMVLLKPPPAILFTNFGASSLDFEIRAILRDVNWVMHVGNDIRHQIAERFAKEDIEIPFAQTDIWLRNPETLPGNRLPEAAEPPAAPSEDAGQADDAPPAPSEPGKGASA